MTSPYQRAPAPNPVTPGWVRNDVIWRATLPSRLVRALDQLGVQQKRSLPEVVEAAIAEFVGKRRGESRRT